MGFKLFKQNNIKILQNANLILNNTSLNSLSSNKIETITNSNYDLKEIISELSNNPIYKDQIINNDSNVFSLIIYLDKNLEMEKATLKFTIYNC